MGVQPGQCRSSSPIGLVTRPSPLVTSGLSQRYHLDESTFIFRGIRSDFSFLVHFSMKIKIANRIAPDGTPRFAASHLGLFCLHIVSHKKGTPGLYGLRKSRELAYLNCARTNSLQPIPNREIHITYNVPLLQFKEVHIKLILTKTKVCLAAIDLFYANRWQYIELYLMLVAYFGVESLPLHITYPKICSQ